MIVAGNQPVINNSRVCRPAVVPPDGCRVYSCIVRILFHRELWR